MRLARWLAQDFTHRGVYLGVPVRAARRPRRPAHHHDQPAGDLHRRTRPGQPPAAVIRLGSPAITYSTSVAGASHDYAFTILLLVGNASTVGQEALDGYLDTSGPDSIYAAIDADPTLGGVADSAEVTTVQNAGLVTWAGADYLGAELLVAVLA